MIIQCTYKIYTLDNMSNVKLKATEGLTPPVGSLGNSTSSSRIATLPAGVNIAHVVKKANQQLTVPVTVSTGGSGVGGAAAGGSAKENLYVIALPPDQLRFGIELGSILSFRGAMKLKNLIFPRRNLESQGLGSQMVTLVSGEKAAAAIKSKVAEAAAAAGGSGGSGLIVTTAGTAQATPGTQFRNLFMGFYIWPNFG